jgi:hypothetical protein
MRTISSGIYLVPRAPSALDAARSGRSYVTVADAAGCSPSFLCELATGAASRVTAELAARIEDALGQARGSLFGLRSTHLDLHTPYLGRPPADVSVSD